VVSRTVDAASEDSEFKIPDVIPISKYISHKFDRNSYVVTETEAGKINIYNQKSAAAQLQDSPNYEQVVTCDINMDPRRMPQTTLCAGAGVLGRTKVGHFQDMPHSMMQIAKRWRSVGVYEVAAAGMSRIVLSTSMGEVYKTALFGLDKWFGLMRGSINLRFVLKTGNFSGKVFYTKNALDLTSYPEPTIEGSHYFDSQTIAQFTVPWTQRTFTSYSDCSEMQGFIVAMIDNYGGDDKIYLEVQTCLGDDFHMGVFMGAPSFFYEFSKISWSIQTIGIPIIEVARWHSKFVSTTPEAGIIENIDRVIETALPIVDKISELSELLDATPLTYQPTPMWPRKIPYSIACDNVQYTERLITTNHNGLSLPDRECFGARTAETDMHNLLVGTKSLVTRVPWSGSDKPATELWSSAIGPMGLAGFDGMLTEVVPSVFNYWTGGVKIILDVIATEMHRGQLLITYTPNSVDSITYGAAPQTYFTTVDLASGRGTVCLFCPYLSEFPYREVIATGVPEDDNSHMGKLTIFVQNPLRATATVSSSVDIVIYKAYSDDFSLGVYGRSDATA